MEGDPSRKFGPLQSDSPLIGKTCMACNTEFTVGQYSALVSLGPGADKEERERCAEGRAYTSVAAPIHWECATGKDPRKNLSGAE